MIDKAKFVDLAPNRQALSVLELADSVMHCLAPNTAVFEHARQSLRDAADAVNGDHERIRSVICFIEDPDQQRDFTVFSEIVNEDEQALAAMETVSYACAFAARVVAEHKNIKPLPDPILEALPDLIEYYLERAKFAICVD